MSDFEYLLREAAGTSDILRDEMMSRHTTFKVGGPAHYFVEPSDAETAVSVLELCRREGVDCAVVGRGSNLLVGDKGYRGVIIHLGEKFSHWHADGNVITADAGITLGALAAAACSLSLGGMEFAAGIPGTLGGALLMNAGAYGGEMKDIVTEVLVYRDGETVWIPSEEMAFRYRGSAAADNGWLILGGRLKLTPADPAAIRARMDELMQARRDKQPLEYPSAGSTFKRPEGYFAGKLIEDSGLKGYAVGGAQVSEKHAGFVINRGGATAADIDALCRHIIRTVEDRFGVTLEPEVRRLGDF